MNDWDKVSAPAEDAGATDWDAVSTPPPKRPPARRRSISRASVAIIALTVAVIGLSVFAGLNLFHIVNFNPGAFVPAQPVSATAQTGAIPATATVNAGAAATIQPARVAALQQLYTQDTGGTPALDDPLSDDRNNWGVFTTNWGGQCAFTGGAYHLSLKYAGYVLICTGADMGALANSANFALQVQIRVAQGDMGGFYFR